MPQNHSVLGGISDNLIILENGIEILPPSIIEGLARSLLPQMQSFFASESGKQTLKQWHEKRTCNR